MAKKALIIEDDANIRELMRLYLEKDGFEVYGAADGGNGLREFKRVEPGHRFAGHHVARDGRLAGMS